jgi:hypothetical protein
MPGQEGIEKWDRVENKTDRSWSTTVRVASVAKVEKEEKDNV